MSSPFVSAARELLNPSFGLWEGFVNTQHKVTKTQRLSTYECLYRNITSTRSVQLSNAHIYVTLCNWPTHGLRPILFHKSDTKSYNTTYSIFSNALVSKRFKWWIKIYVCRDTPHELLCWHSHASSTHRHCCHFPNTENITSNLILRTIFNYSIIQFFLQLECNFYPFNRMPKIFSYTMFRVEGLYG